MNILFVCRHNNDFDTMAPVGDGWARNDPANRSDFLFVSPELNWREDPRSDELRINPNVTLNGILDLAEYGIWKSRLESAWKTSNPDRQLHRRWLQIVTELRVAPRYDRRLREWLDRLSPDLVAFDWYPVPRRRKRFGYFGYQQIMNWAKANAVPLVALPHGLVLFDPPQPAQADFSMYDAIFLESARHARKFGERNRVSGRIFAEGSPRYDPSWVRRIGARSQAQDHTAFSGNAGKTKIVFFATKKVFDFDFPQLLRWLQHLAEHPDVELVIQPHPRGQKTADFGSLARFRSITIDRSTPASALIAAADMVSTLTSSVVVEAALLGREILYPAFCSPVRTRFQLEQACVSLDGMDATHGAIDRFRAGERVARDNYERFLRDDVYASGSPDTIARICARLRELIEERAN